MRKTVLTLIVAIAAVHAFAQEGFIRGKVIEDATGEPLFGATIVKQGTITGTSTDFDGNYSLKLPVGTHNIVFQSVSFQSIVLEGVEVKADEPTILDVVMKEDVQQLGEVVVTATVTKDNDIGVMLVQKKSVNTLDGISSSTFRKVGDSNLSSAMKRVTGVSVQGDKYVYVRGLGDRYTKTSVNGMVIPGLDPDRNDVQIDIFPTGILENVLVYKTFTPDLPGSFTGGLIDIQTKAFPEKKSTSISMSMGYNPAMHFNSNSLSYKGSSTDWLGFDNGSRDLPVAANTRLNEDNATTTLFDPTLGAERGSNFMNSSLSFSHRNQVIGKKLTWGYNALFTYRNRNSYFQDFERRQYERNAIGSDLGLVRDYTAKGDLANNEVLWSGLASIAAKSANTTIGTTFLNIQNGVSTSVKRTRRNTSLNNPTFLYNDILTYTERNMFNNITYGKHQIGDVRLNWTNSFILSSQYEPDYRETAINEDDDQLGFRNGGLINRFWRELSEVNENLKVDLEYEANESNKLKFGGFASFRNREFNVYNYSYSNLSASNVNSSDPNDLEQFIISDSNPTGLYIQNATDESNAYEGGQTLFAAYAMNEMRIGERLKSVYGMRMESVKMTYSGIVENENGIEVPVTDQETLNETNFLPSLSLIYSLSETMNLRGSFTKTLARPSFREKSEAFIVDPITGIWFIGNIDTKQAEILNYDLRWENFFKPGEKIAASLFFKDFTNHIAIVAFEVAPNQVTPRNVGSAFAYGAELEGIKNIFNTPFGILSVGGNFTYTISRVDRSTVTVSETGQNEYQSEVNFKGTEDGVEKYRNMSMQAPFSINGNLSFETTEQDWSANLSYNVQGETLTYVSASIVPEVYTKPFHSLNFKASRNFGLDQNQSLSLRIQNILNDNNELIYRTESDSELFSLRKPGTTFTVSYSYSF
ncbi:MAG: hypothetical protein CMB80_13990 [Flammeovirgaceae bacterium]|nr:hypothetical protein [Flammeovirgaceae bacterium]MBE62815.1 hypothetical protein [Flammeovirgaceae bacterium]MBR06111.1 hypothetical protein [Rickettsiales bacterium]|tara:strand:- start:4961 stop:7741 length:2781 start_codon:yes stop_codon:yes gene_type:complete